MLPVVLAIAAYAINVVYIELARTELQITIDVSTRAAGRVLAVTRDRAQAIAAAERLMAENPFANEQMNLSGSDLEFGVSTRYSERERYAFKPGPNPNAVQIRANGRIKVPMLFPTMGAPIDFRPVKTSISTLAEMDISLVVDRSGSMAFSTSEVAGNYNPAAAPPGWKYGDHVPPNARWLDAVDAVQRFLDLMRESSQDELVCLNTYNSSAKSDVELDSDYLRIEEAMNGYTASFGNGATNIGDGILEGANALADKKTARSWATRVMIVLTDGIHNTGTDPLYAAEQAAAQNILIYTVTFSNEADTKRMQQVAATGAGKHYHAATGAQLVAAFEEIAHSLPTLITY
jgi:Mg-chelatase subunit ChlD